MSQHLKSPYNFVPLADFVHEPEWAAQVSQDVPFEDGLSGVLECELTADTPLHIGAGDKEDGQPVMLNGEPIIPGSSLKGMIRNVLGIACFGRFNRFDDYRMSLRDLTGAVKHVYGGEMVDHDRQKGESRPRVHAGWLIRKDNGWRLQPCSYARIEHSELASARPKLGWQNHMPRCSSADKYSRWGQNADDYRLSISVAEERRKKHGIDLVFDLATLVESNGEDGYLVLTGQPAARRPGDRGKKHLEFVFYRESERELAIPPQVWKDFQRIHNETPEWKFLTSESPYWKAYRSVPIFFLPVEIEGGGKTIGPMGLSQMFRLAYKHSIGDLVPESVREASTQGHFDLTDLMFGDAFQRGDDPFCRGRVQFGLGRPVGEAKPGEKENLILSTPRPSFYPAYVQQDKNGKPAKTYSDDDARLAGWKRYPAADKLREHPGVLENDKMNQHGNMDSPIRALPEGTRFRFKVRFHNLKPEELGALQWTLTLGGNDKLRHRLGMGKPYGYGEVSIRCLEEESCIRPNSGKRETVQVTLEGVKQAFVQHMDKAVPKAKNWQATEQVRALLAMSDPARSNADELYYYSTPKQYQDAKGKSATRDRKEQPMKTLRKRW